jgi:hypothetical protein
MRKIATIDELNEALWAAGGIALGSDIGAPTEHNSYSESFLESLRDSPIRHEHAILLSSFAKAFRSVFSGAMKFAGAGDTVSLDLEEFANLAAQRNSQAGLMYFYADPFQRECARAADRGRNG